MLVCGDTGWRLGGLGPLILWEQAACRKPKTSKGDAEGGPKNTSVYDKFRVERCWLQQQELHH